MAYEHKFLHLRRKIRMVLMDKIDKIIFAGNYETFDAFLDDIKLVVDTLTVVKMELEYVNDWTKFICEDFSDLEDQLDEKGDK